MISELILKDYKSYKKQTIKFDKITTFVGVSNSGKTNILRALEAMLFHLTIPVEHIRHGAKNCEIILKLESGAQIKRKRTHKSQVTTITINGNSTDYDGHNQAKPFVENLLGVKKVVLDDKAENLNFVGVHSGPYMLSGNPNTVHRKVSGILGMNVIEDARTRLSKRARKISPVVEHMSSSLSVMTGSLTEINSSLDRCNKECETIQESYDQWKETEDHLNDIQNLWADHDNYSSILTTINNADFTQDDHKNLEKDLEDCRVLHTKINTINSLFHAELNLANLAQAIESAQENYDRSVKEHKTIVELKKYITETRKMEEYKREIAELEIDINDLEDKKKQALAELSVCPVCGSDI